MIYRDGEIRFDTGEQAEAVKSKLVDIYAEARNIRH